MLEGTNIVLDERDFGKFSVKTYFNLCEKETENHGINLYHGVLEFVDNETGNPLTVKPVINTQEGNIHGHFEDTAEERQRAVDEMGDAAKLIEASIAEAGEDKFFEALKSASEIERAVIDAARTNPAIMLMLSAGISPLDIFKMITEVDEPVDAVEGPDVPLLGGFTL